MALSLLLAACQSQQDPTGNTRLQVRLTDSPGDYEALWIDIRDVQINANGNAERGWVSLQGVRTGRYDLKKLTNGLDTLLAESDIPAGRLQQLRLILGNNNTVVINGQELPLTTPSAQQSGLKLLVATTLEANINYTLVLDFDIARSVVATGSGQYILRPVIRTILQESTLGAIRGQVLPAEASSAIIVLQQNDTVASAFTNAEGRFFVRGLPSGSYRLSILPKEGFEQETIENVSVNAGQITEVSSLTLE